VVSVIPLAFNLGFLDWCSYTHICNFFPVLLTLIVIEPGTMSAVKGTLTSLLLLIIVSVRIFRDIITCYITQYEYYNQFPGYEFYDLLTD
jgi:hypothetical protein